MSFTLDLNTVWFFLVGILFTGYAILDGFDLGVGSLHLFTKTDEERRILLNAIGPVWDGNEVWLVTGGGALFAAFPEAYSTAFSGFYMAMMLLLVGLIFRAVAIEFRSKQPMTWWRRIWDVSFSVSSIASSLLVGVALGNLALGVPLDVDKVYAGSFWTLLNPYALLVGLTAVALFAMHGTIYLVMKTEGELHSRVRGWVNKAIVVFVVLYALTTLATFFFVPRMLDNLHDEPVLFLVPALAFLAIANVPREIHHGRDFRAFLSSCFAMAGLLGTFGLGIYPNLIVSQPQVANSLTIYNAASSARTHEIMLVIALLGMPAVIAYTVSIYWIFRGKVKLEPTSY
jgi:cytochrome d ubiquinol oxidase subunit II